MQKKIDSDAQTWADTFIYLWHSFLQFWAMVPIELKMYLGTMFTVSILMQYYKKSYLTQCTKKDRIQKLWRMSFPTGILLAAIGHFFIYEGKIHLGYFVLTGLTVSTVSMGVHRVVVDYVWPAAKSIISAVWSRVMLLVRGKPLDNQQ